LGFWLEPLCGLVLLLPGRIGLRRYRRVVVDETRVHHVHTRFEGYIEHLYVNYTGQYVRKGRPLFRVYSPELYATQTEHLLSLRARSAAAEIAR
jgi:hypothetical protein